ncbi:hypothetical protein GCM10023183_14400 [Nibribacter koreensis]|uniref:Uncharacterized protein n=2 Tax=Nibribacter koreensis TaxID=1084519 RepID=A0ABP8FFQ1_9BACT
MAGTLPTAVSSASAGTLARELANTLQLNELQYLKLKGFETKKLEAIKAAETALTGQELVAQLTTIESAFSASVLEILTPNQQKAFIGMKTLVDVAQTSPAK